MSAINPASFVTAPNPGMQPNPLGYGPDSTGDRRDRAYDNARGAPDPMLRNPYVDPYPAFGQASRQPEGLGFPGGMQQDPFAAYSPGYGPQESPYADYTGGAGAGPRGHPGGEWLGRFQGLSLGS